MWDVLHSFSIPAYLSYSQLTYKKSTDCVASLQNYKKHLGSTILKLIWLLTPWSLKQQMNQFWYGLVPPHSHKAGDIPMEKRGSILAFFSWSLLEWHLYFLTSPLRSLAPYKSFPILLFPPCSSKAHYQLTPSLSHLSQLLLPTLSKPLASLSWTTKWSFLFLSCTLWSIIHLTTRILFF